MNIIHNSVCMLFACLIVILKLEIGIMFFFYLLKLDSDFDIVNFPFLDGDVPRTTSYGVYISQLIRFARVILMLVIKV